jgi:pimeloyl-ACP methyl ester carboxylesterase
MQAGFNAVYDCIKAFSETDQTDDLKKFDVPALVIQGDDDRADRRFGPDVVQDRQGRYVENLSGCAARAVLDPEGPSQRRPPGIYPDVGKAPQDGSDWVVRI